MWINTRNDQGGKGNNEQVDDVKNFFSPGRAVRRLNDLRYLTIILRARVGYEMIDSQRGA